ncbi:hypothetical protein GCM10018966_071940 [Streptomyces yanii]
MRRDVPASGETMAEWVWHLTVTPRKRTKVPATYPSADASYCSPPPAIAHPFRQTGPAIGPRG